MEACLVNAKGGQRGGLEDAAGGAGAARGAHAATLMKVLFERGGATAVRTVNEMYSEYITSNRLSIQAALGGTRYGYRCGHPPPSPGTDFFRSITP